MNGTVAPSGTAAPRTNPIPRLSNHLTTPLQPSHVVARPMTLLVGNFDLHFVCDPKNKAMKNSFSSKQRIAYSMDPFPQFRRLSKGYMKDGPARVHPNLLVGAGCMLTPEFVKTQKITHIVNCAYDCDAPEWIPESFGSNYTCLQAVDSFDSDITQWYESFEETVTSFLRSPDCQTIYIHCQAGINRSAYLTLMYCCSRLHYNFDMTCKSILVQRPCAFTNYVYYGQVKNYVKNRRAKE